MTAVLFLWYEPNAGGHQSKYMAYMPECPAVGTTVDVSIVQPTHLGETDPEKTRYMRVQEVVWTCDGTVHWHAEVQLE